MNEQPIIITQDLSRRFGTTVAVEGLNLEVQPGEVFGFLGHNGAGKTTTIRLLNGVLAATAGKARVLSLDPALEGPKLRRHTGVLTETPSLDERLTGRDNLTIYADLYDVPVGQVKSRVDELLDTFELAERADEKAGNYSKGMKQRLALARALLHRPVLLFLDEPTSGLDPVATRRVHNLIGHLSKEEGRTVFLCTHNLAEAQKLCHRVGVMENGRLLAIGTPSDLARQMTHTHQLLLETEPDRVLELLQVIAAFPGLEAGLGDNGLVNVTGAERSRVPDLLALLHESGIPIYQATPQEPTLADVYFALHEVHKQ